MTFSGCNIEQHPVTDVSQGSSFEEDNDISEVVDEEDIEIALAYAAEQKAAVVSPIHQQ